MKAGSGLHFSRFASLRKLKTRPLMNAITSGVHWIFTLNTCFSQRQMKQAERAILIGCNLDGCFMISIVLAPSYNGRRQGQRGTYSVLPALEWIMDRA